MAAYDGGGFHTSARAAYRYISSCSVCWPCCSSSVYGCRADEASGRYACRKSELAGLIVICYADVAVGAICFGQVCCALKNSSGGGRDRDALARIGSRSAKGASR
jgi:hypothetical protein